MTPDDYVCKKCDCGMYVPDGMDPLEKHVRFCEGCMVAELERLQKELAFHIEACGAHQRHIDELQAVIDRLPKDAEGNPIAIGDTRYTILGKQITVQRIAAKHVSSEEGYMYQCRRIYKSREAAEKARAI